MRLKVCLTPLNGSDCGAIESTKWMSLGDLKAQGIDTIGMLLMCFSVSGRASNRQKTTET